MARIRVLERRMCFGGDCSCGENPKRELVYCRDPRVSEPPRRVCSSCGRPVRRVLLQAGDDSDRSGPAYQAFSSLRDYYAATVKPTDRKIGRGRRTRLIGAATRSTAPIPA